MEFTVHLDMRGLYHRKLHNRGQAGRIGPFDPGEYTSRITGGCNRGAARECLAEPGPVHLRDPFERHDGGSTPASTPGRYVPCTWYTTTPPARRRPPGASAAGLRTSLETRRNMTGDLISRWKYSNLIAAGAILLLTVAA
jgi:hypothetical protein